MRGLQNGLLNGPHTKGTVLVLQISGRIFEYNLHDADLQNIFRLQLPERSINLPEEFLKAAYDEMTYL